MNEMTKVSTAHSDPAVRDRIEDLLTAYSHAIDDGQIEQWPEFFTEDCVYHITTRETHEAGLPIGILRCVGRGMMHDRVKAFHTANIFEPHGRAETSSRHAGKMFSISPQRGSAAFEIFCYVGASDIYVVHGYDPNVVFGNELKTADDRVDLQGPFV